MNLEEAINNFREQVKDGPLSEAQVVLSGVQPVLRELGWPVDNNPTIVYPEYEIKPPNKKTQYVDFALCHPETNKPLVFIEAKKKKKNTIHVEKGEKQLLQYAFQKNIRLAILTNGQNWKFYAPMEKGTYGERCGCNLIICENNLRECVYRLNRYLRYEEVLNKQAFTAIRKDCEEARAEELAHREIEKTLPDAWQKIVQVNETIFIDLLRRTVNNMCGYQPTEERIQAFLKALVVVPSPHQDTTPPLVSSSEFKGFVLRGKQYQANTSIVILVGVFNKLAGKDPSFLERFFKSDFNWYRDRYRCLAKDKEDLLDPEKTQKLGSGWYIDKTLSRETKVDAIKVACQVFSEGKDDGNKITYGDDLILHLPPKHTRERQSS